MMEGMTHESKDGTTSSANLYRIVAATHRVLSAHASKIDTLNVYPVPDGDTGANMLLTLRSVLDAISSVSYDLSGRETARTVSRAALMGARGNSGVILSQIIHGACEVLGEAQTLDAETLAAALEGGKERAYTTVQSPIEGTMLSVIKDAAAAARLGVEEGVTDPLKVLRVAAQEAHASVKRTPELLGVLKEAGVVDAGGLGVAVILDGLLTTLGGENLQVGFEEEAAADGKRLREAVAHSAEEAWGYCTEFIVTDFSGDEREFETYICEIGKSVLVMSDEDLVKVHLHTQDPGGALTYAGSFGRLFGVKVEDMEAQTRDRAESSGIPDTSSLESASSLSVIAASRGEGNRKLFEGMGAAVVEGGQGANPSVEDFARAVKRTGASTVILLPNNSNIVPTAEQVDDLVEAEVHVVATTSIAGGLAAMIGFDPEDEAEEVVREMREIAGGLLCAEVTRAARKARIGGRVVPEGAYIGFLDGELLAVEEDVEDAALKLIEKMLGEGVDIITLLRGYGLEEASARKISERAKLLEKGVEVEIKDGGQPLYPLQMVAE